MIRISYYDNAPEQVKNDIVRYVNENIENEIRCVLDYIQDGVPVESLLPVRMTGYTEEQWVNLIHELLNIVQAPNVRRYLKPKYEYLLYYILRWQSDSYDEEEQFLYDMPKLLENAILVSYNEEEDGLGEYIVSGLKDIREYLEFVFEDYDFLPNMLDPLVQLYIDNRETYDMCFPEVEIEEYRELMSPDLREQYDEVKLVEEKNNTVDGEENSMLSAFPTEKLELHKKNGTFIETIEALVEPNCIFVDDISIVIEEDDVFIRTLPNGGIEYYLVTESGFYKGAHGIPDHYQVKTEKISSDDYKQKRATQGSEDMKEKTTKIFISHSSKDEYFVKRIVELLEDLNIPEEGIFCSSIPEYGIPGGQKIYEFLREQFENYNLHVFFVLSDNYYESIASMNEMGAAWVLHSDHTTMLLPGFDYASIQGVIDATEIATKLDEKDDFLKARLGELKDKLEKDFGLSKMNANKWERKRDAFIKDILTLSIEK